MELLLARGVVWGKVLRCLDRRQPTGRRLLVRFASAIGAMLLLLLLLLLLRVIVLPAAAAVAPAVL